MVLELHDTLMMAGHQTLTMTAHLPGVVAAAVSDGKGLTVMPVHDQADAVKQSAVAGGTGEAVDQGTGFLLQQAAVIHHLHDEHQQLAADLAAEHWHHQQHQDGLYAPLFEHLVHDRHFLVEGGCPQQASFPAHAGSLQAPFGHAGHCMLLIERQHGLHPALAPAESHEQQVEQRLECTWPDLVEQARVPLYTIHQLLPEQCLD